MTKGSLTSRVSYPRDTRDKAKRDSKGLVTVDVRMPGRKPLGGTIQLGTISPEKLDWFLAFSIHLLSLDENPETAWASTYGSPHYPGQEINERD